MEEERRLPNPLRALNGLTTAIGELDRFLKALDGRITDVDRTFKQIDKELSNPRLPQTTPLPSRKPTGRSYEGQTELSYCVECCIKHSQTAKVLAREALQRAEADMPSSPGVQEKVRGVVEELAGFEDDSDTVENEKVVALNTMARALRKYIYTTGAEIGRASITDLRRMKSMVDQLVEATYLVRKGEETCVGCTVEEICGGNLECVEFLTEAAKKARSPKEFEEFMEEARRRYVSKG